MNNRSITNRQLWRWILLSLTAPLAVIAGKSGWIWTLAISALSTAACWILRTFWNESRRIPKWYHILHLIWIVMSVGEMCRWSMYCWPKEQSLLIPFTLLFLSALAARGGAERSARIANTILTPVVVLYLIVLLSGMEGMEWSRVWKQQNTFSWELVFVSVLPGAGIAYSVKGKRENFHTILIPVFAFTVALLVFGVLGEGTKEVFFPFYTFSQSLNLLNTAKRFEAIVSAALTLGFYSLTSFLLGSLSSVSENLQWDHTRTVTLCALGAAAVLLIRGFPLLWLAILSLALWILLPAFMLFGQRINKSKKDEKTT